MADERLLYRAFIDALVVQCRDGQGQVSARRVQVGVWNAVAEEDGVEADPDQHEMNELLRSLSERQRAVLATLFAQEFESGVYNVLQGLHAAGIPPFHAHPDGVPGDNFLDRLDNWQWPADRDGG